MARITAEQQERRNEVYDRVWNCEITLLEACVELDLSVDYVLKLYNRYLIEVGRVEDG